MVSFPLSSDGFSASGVNSASITQAIAALTPTIPAKTADYTAAPGDLVLVDASSAGVVVQMPAGPSNGSMIGVNMVGQGVDPATGVLSVVTILPGAGDSLALFSVQNLRYVNQGMVYQYSTPAAQWVQVSQSLTLDALQSSFVGLVNPSKVQGELMADSIGVVGIPGVTLPTQDFGLFQGTGAPTSGTWPTGARMIDQAGANLICTSGGTPGVWTVGTGGSAGTGTPPTVITGAATGLTATDVVFNGTCNPNSLGSTAHFEYGPTAAYGTMCPPSDITVGSDAIVHTVSLRNSISNPGNPLAASTLYHFRLVCTNSAGSSNGADQTFTTPAAASAPTIAVPASSAITNTGVILSANVNPQNQAATYQIQLGLTTAYGTSLPASPVSIGSGGADVPVSQFFSGLTAGTTYHWRVQAINATGTTNLADQTFATTVQALPAVVTNPASGVTATGATLNGTVNPNGAAAAWQFQYGLTTAYGSVAPVPAASGGSASAPSPQLQAVSGLAANTPYHFRLTANNSGGTTYGSDQTFTTSAAPSGTLVKFERTTYSNSFPLSAAVDVAHGISYYVLQADLHSSVAGLHAAAAAAGAKLKVLCYMNLPYTRSSDSPTGSPPPWTVPIAYNVAVSNGYLATNSSGHTLWFNGQDYVLDLTKTAVRNAIVANVKAMCAAYNFDGVFFDNCNSYAPGWANKDTVTQATSYPTWGTTSSAIETAFAACLSAIVPQFQAAGLTVIGNVGNFPTNTGFTIQPGSHFGTILNTSLGGGIYLEGWMDGGAGLAQQMTNFTNGIPSDFTNMQQAIYLDSRGVDVICHNQNTTAAGQKFGLATMMLCTTGHCYYTTDQNLGGTDNWFTPEYANALGSGAAIDPPVTPGTPTGTGADTGLYVRRFANCTVKANMSAAGPTINGLTNLAGAGPYASIQ